jgi:hypothetical protein
MTHAEDTYHALVLLKEWDISGTNSSSFNAAGRGQRGPTNNNGSVSNPIYLPPTEGGSEVKEINGREHKYCRRCRRWRGDADKHTTSEHVRRSDLPPQSSVGTNATSPASTPSPAVTVTPDSTTVQAPSTTSTPSTQPSRLPRNPAYSSTTRVSFAGGL